MSDIYYAPEKHGLTTVGEFDMSDGCYQFNLFVVWRDEAGTYYWGSDSGCSCPSPFETFTVSDLTAGTSHQAAAAVQKALDDRDDYDQHGDTEAVELIARLVAS